MNILDAEQFQFIYNLKLTQWEKVLNKVYKVHVW